jgi:AmmeMemoRadiSam system protein B/AmmeMemoRadiSam system protein A
MRALYAVALGLLLTTPTSLPGDPPKTIAERAPAVAGKFYPADPQKLEGAVRAYLEDAVEPTGARPLALVVPHAGYIYSGQIAADGYRQALGHEYDLVVVLGTNHTASGFRGVSVYRGTGYRTPLGLAKIDTELVDELIAVDEAFTFDPRVHLSEHSVEVQIPFVQVAFPNAKIVAAVVGTPDRELCRRFGRVLAGAVRDRRALVVASSDLSHYPAYEDAVSIDRSTLEAIAGLDSEALQITTGKQLRRKVANLGTCACGEAPVMAVMEASLALGASSGRVVSYANSGDTAIGDRSRVVGYGAVTFHASGEGEADSPNPSEPPAESSELDPGEKKALLAFARESIRRYLTTGTAPLARACSPATASKRGAFVTLKIDDELRGCRGYTEPDLPICQVVGAMALQAAFNDKRFPALRDDELDRVEIEISLLTPLEKVPGPEAVVPGRDGVRIYKLGHSAIFLPQVAAERGWNRTQYLDQLCSKAGLPRGGWRDDAELYTFQAEVFNESDSG